MICLNLDIMSLCIYSINRYKRYKSSSFQARFHRVFYIHDYLLHLIFKLDNFILFLIYYLDFHSFLLSHFPLYSFLLCIFNPALFYLQCSLILSLLLFVCLFVSFLFLFKWDHWASLSSCLFFLITGTFFTKACPFWFLRTPCKYFLKLPFHSHRIIY